MWLRSFRQTNLPTTLARRELRLRDAVHNTRGDQREKDTKILDTTILGTTVVLKEDGVVGVGCRITVQEKWEFLSRDFLGFGDGELCFFVASLPFMSFFTTRSRSVYFHDLIGLLRFDYCLDSFFGSLGVFRQDLPWSLCIDTLFFTFLTF